MTKARPPNGTQHVEPFSVTFTLDVPDMETCANGEMPAHLLAELSRVCREYLPVVKGEEWPPSIQQYVKAATR